MVTGVLWDIWLARNEALRPFCVCPLCSCELNYNEQTDPVWRSSNVRRSKSHPLAPNFKEGKVDDLPINSTHPTHCHSRQEPNFFLQLNGNFLCRIRVAISRRSFVAAFPSLSLTVCILAFQLSNTRNSHPAHDHQASPISSLARQLQPRNTTSLPVINPRLLGGHGGTAIRRSSTQPARGSTQPRAAGPGVLAAGVARHTPHNHRTHRRSAPMGRRLFSRDVLDSGGRCAC